jgi:hypothetical protein
MAELEGASKFVTKTWLLRNNSKRRLSLDELCPVAVSKVCALFKTGRGWDGMGRHGTGQEERLTWT